MRGARSIFLLVGSPRVAAFPLMSYQQNGHQDPRRQNTVQRDVASAGARVYQFATVERIRVPDERVLFERCNCRGDETCSCRYRVQLGIDTPFFALLAALYSPTRGTGRCQPRRIAM